MERYNKATQKSIPNAKRHENDKSESEDPETTIVNNETLMGEQIKNVLNSPTSKPRYIPPITRGPIPNEAKFRIWKPPIQPQNPRSLKIAVLGPPNAGKSSLINALTKSWVSSVSPKVNTTTTSNIRGILTLDNTQLIFIDSPGITSSHRNKSFSRPLLSAAWRGYEEADICLMIIDCVKRPDQQIFEVIRTIAPQINSDDLVDPTKTILTSIQSPKVIGISSAIHRNRLAILTTNKKYDKISEEHQENPLFPPICLVLNKIDLVSHKKWMMTRKKEFETQGQFEKFFFVSSKNKIGLENLITYLKNKAKPCPWLYPPDMTTSLSKIQQVEQLARTYTFCWFNKDVPYKIDHETTGWNETNDDISIEQEIIVPSLKVKKMICGIRNRLVFQMMKNITYKLQELWGKPVNMHIEVRVRSSR